MSVCLFSIFRAVRKIRSLIVFLFMVHFPLVFTLLIGPTFFQSSQAAAGHSHDQVLYVTSIEEIDAFVQRNGGLKTVELVWDRSQFSNLEEAEMVLDALVLLRERSFWVLPNGSMVSLPSEDIHIDFDPDYFNPSKFILNKTTKIELAQRWLIPRLPGFSLLSYLAPQIQQLHLIPPKSLSYVWQYEGVALHMVTFYILSQSLHTHTLEMWERIREGWERHSRVYRNRYQDNGATADFERQQWLKHLKERSIDLNILLNLKQTNRRSCLEQILPPTP